MGRGIFFSAPGPVSTGRSSQVRGSFSSHVHAQDFSEMVLIESNQIEGGADRCQGVSKRFRRRRRLSRHRHCEVAGAESQCSPKMPEGPPEHVCEADEVFRAPVNATNLDVDSPSRHAALALVRSQAVIGAITPRLDGGDRASDRGCEYPVTSSSSTGSGPSSHRGRAGARSRRRLGRTQGAAWRPPGFKFNLLFRALDLIGLAIPSGDAKNPVR
jgi:hypothetical protein